jgi:N-acetylmuramoyl-L-alanine amidase
VITLIAAIGGLVYRLRDPDSAGAAEPPTPTPQAVVAPGSLDAEADAPGPSTQPTPTAGPTPTPIPVETLAAPTLEPSSAVPRIGVVAGHWGHDTGAVCDDDGSREVDVNLTIAAKLVKILEGLGYEVELLEEFDVRLHGYSADALISIHADSCEPFPDANPPLSGFKVASVEDSWVPDAEQKLVACLVHHYGERTGMTYHEHTVTFDMRHYHTFYEVDGFTPAAIIETGFMYADRHIVAGQPDLVAQAIAEGILCFLEPEGQ